MRECLLCYSPLKWIKFKCADGYVCKNCYEKVSTNFTQTIKSKNKKELLTILADLQEEMVDSSFEISRKINQLIFFDDNNQQICLPNHKKYTKENLKPEVYPLAAILNCEVVEEEIERIVKKKKQRLGCIKVVLRFENDSRDIWLIPNFINRDSMAYKTMRSLANSIVAEVKKSKECMAC